ncbi:MAG: type II toxin-antitoxin system VapB family antitoxin [Terriglobales bacterium]
MWTIIDIDDALMRKAIRLSGLTTKKAVVEAALRLFSQTHSQSGIRGLRGRSNGEGTLAQLSQLRTFFGFFVMIFVLKSCVFIVGI